MLPNSQFSTSEDTLKLYLSAARNEAQDSAMLRVSITALIQSGQKDTSKLNGEIRASLNQLIKADWVFSNIQRHGESVGYERIRLSASARVGLDEIYNLNERARSVCKEGLEISEPHVDNSLPAKRVTQATSLLRLQILKDVMEQIPLFNAATGRQWRIGNIDFGVKRDDEDNSVRFTKGGYRNNSIEDISRDCEFAGGERFSLLAEVILKSIPHAQ